MDALDGNAIAGRLVEVFGRELTTAIGTCASCGSAAPVAELVVYLRAPGTVVRCRSCRSVLMVFTAIREINCVDLGGLADLTLRRRAAAGELPGQISMARCGHHATHLSIAKRCRHSNSGSGQTSPGVEPINRSARSLK